MFCISIGDVRCYFYKWVRCPCGLDMWKQVLYNTHCTSAFQWITTELNPKLVNLHTHTHFGDGEGLAKVPTSNKLKAPRCGSIQHNSERHIHSRCVRVCVSSENSAQNPLEEREDHSSRVRVISRSLYLSLSHSFSFSKCSSLSVCLFISSASPPLH